MDKEEWRQYKRGYDALLKNNHLCRNCKGQDGRTLNGFVLCWDCVKKEYESQRKLRSDETYKEKRRVYENERYAQRKADGKCPCCGRKLYSTAYKTCSHCRALKRKSKNKADAERRALEGVNWPRGANGYCWRCNKRKAIEGKKLCEECYQAQLVRLQHTWAVNAERRKNAECKSC